MLLSWLISTPVHHLLKEERRKLYSLRRSSFKRWWTGVLINQDRSIREKMTLFWANHFGTETADIGNAHYVYRHHNLLRQSCLGNFKQLIKDVTIDRS